MLCLYIKDMCLSAAIMTRLVNDLNNFPRKVPSTLDNPNNGSGNSISILRSIALRELFVSVLVM